MQIFEISRSSYCGFVRLKSLNVVNYTPSSMIPEIKAKDRPKLVDPLTYYLQEVLEQVVLMYRHISDQYITLKEKGYPLYIIKLMSLLFLKDIVECDVRH